MGAEWALRILQSEDESKTPEGAGEEKQSTIQIPKPVEEQRPHFFTVQFRIFQVIWLVLQVKVTFPLKVLFQVQVQVQVQKRKSVALIPKSILFQV